MHIYMIHIIQKNIDYANPMKMIIIISNDVFIYENFNYNCNSVSISLNTIFADMI